MSEQQDGGGRLAPVQSKTSVEAWVKGAGGWYAQLVPSHMAPDHFQALLLNVLRKDAKLMDAAEANPWSFRAAANECARLGLVPGVNFWFVPFLTTVTDQAGRKSKEWEIAPIAGWKGEIDLAHRANPNLAAVVVQVVRQGGAHPDLFRWSPTRMVVPEHEIMLDGLATAAERGPLRAVYCFGRYRDGSVSTCVVVRRDEVQKHRNVAKTDKFWGPKDVGGPVKEELPWSEDMWLKTAVHVWADMVPHSPEFEQNLIRTASLIANAGGLDRMSTGQVLPRQIASEPPAASRPRLALAATAGDDPAAGDDTPASPRPAAATQGGAPKDQPGHTPPAGPGEGRRKPADARAARTASTRGAQPPPPQDSPSDEVRARVAERLSKMPLGPPEEVAAALAWLTGLNVSDVAELTDGDCERVDRALGALLERAGDYDAAAAALWEMYELDKTRGLVQP